MSPGISSRDRIILMIRACQAIPKRIHRETMFLYHTGYFREGSIPGEKARPEEVGAGQKLGGLSDECSAGNSET